MRYNVYTNWEPLYAHKHPCSRRARTKLERVIAQIDRGVPLKVRACEGTSEGSWAELFMLGHAPCRSNSSSKKSALAATSQIGGNPALDLKSAGGAWRRGDSVPRRQNIEPSTLLWGLEILSPSRVWHERIKVDHCDPKTHYCYL